jgi:acetate kinase
MTMKIVVLNAGSSSQKSKLYELAEELPEQPPRPLWEATADWAEHRGETDLKVTTVHGETVAEILPTDSRREVIEHLLNRLVGGKTQVLSQLTQIDIVGHRVVHGGQEYREATVITPTVKDVIKRLAEFAPLHNPVNLEGIEVVERMLPHVPQVAVFDTSRSIASYPWHPLCILGPMSGSSAVFVAMAFTVSAINTAHSVRLNSLAEIWNPCG